MKWSEVFTAFFIAKKNIERNGKSLLLTVLIISLGFISSVIIYGVLNNVNYVLQENFIETNLGHISLEPYGYEDKIEGVDAIIKQVENLPNVLGVSSVFEKSARMVDQYGNYVDSQIYVVDSEDFSEVSLVDDMIIDGDWLSEGKSGEIVLGCVSLRDCNENEAYNRIDIEVGESFDFIVGNGRVFPLVLKGIYNHQYIEAGLISYIDKKTAEIVFDDYDSQKVDKIIIRIPDREFSDQVVEDLIELNLNVEILDWEEKSSRYSSMVDSFGVIGDISFLLGIIISSISIYIILYINILNKRTQIGIIKAIGVRSEVIGLSYVFLSFFLGILGSIFGVFLTLSMIEMFKVNPIHTGLGDMIPEVSSLVLLIVAGVVVLASIISGFVVSRKISKENIIEAISRG